MHFDFDFLVFTAALALRCCWWLSDSAIEVPEGVILVLLSSTIGISPQGLLHYNAVYKLVCVLILFRQLGTIYSFQSIRHTSID